MKRETQSFYQQTVTRAVQRVVDGLDAALDLGALAKSASLSAFHFHRVFRGMVGETALELHRRLRLERAAWCLVETDSPVTTIAFDAGYETHEAFTRAFRKRYARSPSEARKQRPGVDCLRPFQIELAAPSGIHFRPEGFAALEIQFTQGESNMNVDITTLDELRVAAVRHVGPYSRISEAFARLGSLAGPAGLIAGDSKMLAIYHDDPEATAEAELRSDAGVSVKANAELPEGLEEHRIVAGRYARMLHVGPYEQLGDAWSRLLGQWLPASGERLGDGLSFEIYENTPMDVPKNELRTVLHVPLA